MNKTDRDERRKKLWDRERPIDYLYIAIVVAAAIAMAVLFTLILLDRNTIQNQAKEIQREANVRAAQIQQQRYDVTLKNCEDQNDRNIHTIGTLNKEIAGLPASQQAQAQRSKQFTILLINALVPKRDCKAVARAAVHPLPNSKG